MSWQNYIYSYNNVYWLLNWTNLKENHHCDREGIIVIFIVKIIFRCFCPQGWKQFICWFVIILYENTYYSMYITEKKYPSAFVYLTVTGIKICYSLFNVYVANCYKLIAVISNIITICCYSCGCETCLLLLYAPL